MTSSRRTGASQTAFPRAPTLRRRIGSPLRLAAALLLLTALPATAALGFLGDGVLDRVLRVAATFVALLALFRVIGKRELGRLSPFELVTLMLVPEVLSNAVQAQGPLVDALAALSMLFCLVLATSALAHRFERVEKALEPRSTILVDHGQLVEAALNSERIVPDELFSEMRRHGILDLSEVRWAVLESGGNITFIPRRTPAAADDEGPEAT